MEYCKLQIKVQQHIMVQVTLHEKSQIFPTALVFNIQNFSPRSSIKKGTVVMSNLSYLSEIREVLLYLSRAELQYGGYGGYHLLFD